MLKKNIVSSVITQVGRIVLGFLINVVIARVLGSVALGQVNYFFVIFGILGSYGHFGVLNATSYCYKNDVCDGERQFRTNVTYLVLNCAMWFVLLSIPYVKNLLLSDMPYVFVILGAIYILVMYLNSAFTEYCVADEKVYASNRTYLIGLFIAAVGVGVLSFLGRMTAQAYVVCKILEYLISVVVLCFVIKKHYKPLLDFGFLKRELKYGNIIFWAALFIYLNYRIDQVMIKFQLGDSELGIYSIAVSLAELVFLVPLSLTSAITGKLLNMNDDKQQKEKVLCLTIKGCLYLSILISVIGFLCTPLIPVIYGVEYSGAMSCFVVLLLGVCFASVAKVMAPYYLTGGQPRIHLFVTMLTVVVNVVFNIILIPKIGIIGAAIGSTISYMVYGLSYVFLFRFKEKVLIKDMLLLSRTEMKLMLGSVLKIKKK